MQILISFDNQTKDSHQCKTLWQGFPNCNHCQYWYHLATRLEIQSNVKHPNKWQPDMKTRNAVHVENYLVRQEIWSGTREINMTKIKTRAQIQIIVMATTMGIPHFNDQSIWQIYYFLKYTIIPKSKSWFPFKVSELLVNVWSLYQVLRPLEKSDSAKLSSWDLWDLNESSGDRTNEFLRWDLWGPETFREIWFSEIELLRPLGFKRELRRQDKRVPEIFSVIEITHKISRNQDLRCSKSAPLLKGPGARWTSRQTGQEC